MVHTAAARSTSAQRTSGTVCGRIRIRMSQGAGWGSVGMWNRRAPHASMIEFYRTLHSAA